MKALSVKQPWATLIVMGCPILDVVQNDDGSSRLEWQGKVIIKDIENRTWPLPKWFQTPQRIYIHASKRVDGHDALTWLLQKGLPVFQVLMLFGKRNPKGALIGEVDIVACVTESASPWFIGPYGFVLANPLPYDDPILCKGKLGFFEPTIEELQEKLGGAL